MLRLCLCPFPGSQWNWRNLRISTIAAFCVLSKHVTKNNNIYHEVTTCQTSLEKPRFTIFKNKIAIHTWNCVVQKNNPYPPHRRVSDLNPPPPGFIPSYKIPTLGGRLIYQTPSMGWEWICFGTTRLINATVQLSILILSKPDVMLYLILLDWDSRNYKRRYIIFN